MTGEIRLVADLPYYLVVGYEGNEGYWHEDTGFREPPTIEAEWLQSADWLPWYVHESVGDTFSPTQAAMLAAVIERSFAAHPFPPESDEPDRVSALFSWLRYWAETEEIGVVVEPGDRDSDHTQ